MPPLLSLLFLLLLIGALAAAGAIVLMGWALAHPPLMTDGKAAYLLKRLSPGDLNLPFEPITIGIRDERTGRPLTIAGWWIPRANAAGRCVVLVHGYADAKVGAIAWAPTWHALGFNVLAIDLRAHGESGGDACAAGFFERHDVAAVVGQLRAGRPADARQVVLFGISLGAAAAVGAAALREGVADAVVLESPFADFRSAARAHYDLLGLPGPAFQRAAVAVAQWLTGADFRAARPVDLIPRVACPVMVIAPAEDVFVPTDEAAALERAVARRANPLDVFWHVADAHHLQALYASPEAYRRRVGAFVERALGVRANADEAMV